MRQGRFAPRVARAREQNQISFRQPRQSAAGNVASKSTKERIAMIEAWGLRFASIASSIVAISGYSNARPVVWRMGKNGELCCMSKRKRSMERAEVLKNGQLARFG